MCGQGRPAGIHERWARAPTRAVIVIMRAMSTDTANGRRSGAAGAALDILLTDAAVGNPPSRVLTEPAGIVRGAVKIAAHPDRVVRRGGGFGRELARAAAGSSDVVPAKGDRRFADSAWQKSWLFRRLAQAYLAAGGAVDGLIDDADLDWRADTTARFVARNVHDLLAPTNFPWSNPAVLKETLDQGGANLVKGLRRAGHEIGARRLPAMVDTSRFEVGGNLALSEGSVVLRTEVFELIQYKPKTATVHEIPLLIAPPTINKYYVLDLAPGRSIVEYLVAQGQQVFVISWRNPGQAEGHFDFDTYAAAIAGTMSALGRRELAAAAVAESARRGYLDGSALANVFAWLRPNDLVWGYVINNYLMGKEPPAFDILYWNQDGVRLAAGLHHDFVRMALDNTLATPGAMTGLGSDIDLGRVDVDVYTVAGLNDHIVPWENAYRGTRLFGGSRRFVLSTSGHIQALINPPGPESRSSFRVAEELPAAEGEFLRGTPTTSGSWWPDYARWLVEHAGERKPARKTLGNAKYKPTAKASGSYVHAS